MSKYIFFGLLLMQNTAYTLTIDPAGVGVSNRVVVVEATVEESPPQITIHFLSTYYDNYPYKIYRRALHGNNWGTKIVTVPAKRQSWTDNNVSVGDVYEYQIRKKTGNRDAIGYIAAGISYDQSGYRGRMVLLIDDTIITPLSNEIEQLKTDLVGDGWLVETIVAQRVEGWNGGQAVTVVKQQIVNAYNAAPTNDKPKLLFIFGHVPVARSGLALEAADGHPENEGALASDAYYADIDGIWTDTGTHTSPTDPTQTTFSDPNNINIPGDYKWDQNYIPSELELAFGRVDFADIVLPTTSEIQLYKNYLNKLHNYRHVANGYDVGRKIAIRAKGYEEGIDSSYRNGLPIVGSANIVHQNNDTWLSDTGHANWVNNNGPFLAYFQNMWKPEINLINQLGGLNAMLYSSDKSYWGLWGKATVPVRDGNLDEWLGVGLSRALLATGGLNLIVLWGTSPASSIFFQAGIGETIGYSMKRSMDHDNNKFNIFEYHGGASGYGEPNGHYFLKHCKTRHSQFHGDPSIRFFSVKPASNLVTTTNSNSVSLAWNSSSDTQIIGYHVYRSNDKLGKYTKFTTNPVTSTSYTDHNPLTGDNWYMLRAIKLDTTGSGSFLNPSQGIFAKAVMGNTPPPSTVTPPSNLVANINNNTVSLTWNPSPDNNLIGYDVYHSTTELGQYTKLTTTPVTSTSYTDNNPVTGDNWYMVEAIKPDASSQGIFVKATIQITVTPPSNVVVNINNNTVSLIWNPSPDNNLIGYDVYHSTTELGQYTKLTTAPVTSTSYTYNNPVTGNNWYMVKAIKQDASGNTFSSEGVFAKATIQITVTPPSNLVANINNKIVSLTWNPSPDTNIIGYDVYHSTIKLGKYTKLTTTPVTSISYIHNNQVTGNHWYMVKAIKADASGNTLSSEGIFAKAIIETTVTAPSNLVANINNNTVYLTWNPSPNNNILGYNVYHSTTKLGKYTKLTTTPVTSTSYTHNNPVTGDHWYIVKAIKPNASGNTLSSEGISVKATIPTTVTDPSNLVANINNNTVSLTWNPSPDNNIIGYDVYHSTTKLGKYTKLTTTPVTSTSYTHNNPVTGNHWYIVKAIKPNASGNTLSSEGISVKATIPTTVTDPSNLVANINNNTVSLTWNPSPDNNIIGYDVYHSTTKLGQYTKLTTAPVTSTSYTHNNPVTGDHWYIVKAIKPNASGNTLSSEGIFVKATIQTTPSSTITIDFENLPLGNLGTVGATNQYNDPKGFTFKDDLNDIMKIFGAADFYPSKVLHPNEWSRQIFITRTNGGTFDLTSFQYGQDIWGYTVEATVTGDLTSGGTVSQTYTVSNDNMQTLNLNWKNLSSLKIDFSIGANGNYGALDNFVLVIK